MSSRVESCDAGLVKVCSTPVKEKKSWYSHKHESKEAKCARVAQEKLLRKTLCVCKEKDAGAVREDLSSIIEAKKNVVSKKVKLDKAQIAAQKAARAQEEKRLKEVLLFDVIDSDQE